MAPVGVPPIPDDDLLPADVRAVVELFTAQLANVAFPDVDAQSLRRGADELRADAANVAAARAALEAAVAQSAARVAALTANVTRALAYARIYSEAHPERTALAEALGALAPAATSPALTGTGKRRGRPPKNSAELFDAPRLSSEPPHDAAP